MTGHEKWAETLPLVLLNYNYWFFYLKKLLCREYGKKKETSVSAAVSSLSMDYKSFNSSVVYSLII